MSGRIDSRLKFSANAALGIMQSLTPALDRAHKSFENDWSCSAQSLARVVALFAFRVCCPLGCPRNCSQRFQSLCLLLFLLVGSAPAQGQTLYFDVNGGPSTGASSATNGSGVTNGSNYSWGGNFWSSGSNGQTKGGSNLASAWTANANAVFSAGTDGTGAYTVAIDANTSVGTVTIQEGSPTFSISSGFTWTFDSTTSFTLASVVTGLGALTKSNTNTLTLSGANSYSGVTNVGAGTLAVTVNNALGTAGSGTTVASGATLDFKNVAYATAESLTVNGGTVATSTGTSSFAGALALGAGGATVNVAGTQLTLSGALTGSTALTKSGAGALVLSNAGNAHTGGTVLSAGTLTVSSGAALAAASGALTVNGGTLALNNAAQSVGSFSGTGGTVTFGTGHRLTIAQTTATSFAGNLGGAGGLTMAGSGGTLTLSGTDTYTGSTIISAGTLRYAATTALPSASSFSLGGGMLQIGVAGTFATSGTLTLTANSTIDFGSGLGATTISFGNSSATSWTAGRTLTIINYNSASGDQLRVGTTSGGITAQQLSQITFSGFSAGASISSSGYLTPGAAIPEPATYAAMFGAISLLFARYFRRGRTVAPVAA